MTADDKLAAEAAANMPEWIDCWDPAQSTYYYCPCALCQPRVAAHQRSDCYL